jgi:hypothetical protein
MISGPAGERLRRGDHNLPEEHEALVVTVSLMKPKIGSRADQANDIISIVNQKWPGEFSPGQSRANQTNQLFGSQALNNR